MASNPITPSSYGSEPVQPNTTFVQADTTNFRTIVQKLTGAPDHSLSERSSGPRHLLPKVAHKHSGFNLHERRFTRNNYKSFHLDDLNLNLNPRSSISSLCEVNGSFMFSPVSTLDYLSSPVINSPMSPSYGDQNLKHVCCGYEEAEERAIAEKGFFLHPIDSRTADPPELLCLFPLTSPRKTEHKLS